MYNRNETAFFTGPRAKKLIGYNRHGYTELVNFLAEKAIEIHNKFGITNFVSGGAQGFDQLAFWAVNRAKINHPELSLKNILLLPFLGQSDIWAEKGLFGKTEYNLMLDKADDVIYSYNRRHEKNQTTKLLMERNTTMRDMSKLCIGLWTTDDAWQNDNTKGGTADALRKADKTKLDMFIVRYEIKDNMVVPLHTDYIQAQA